MQLDKYPGLTKTLDRLRVVEDTMRIAAFVPFEIINGLRVLPLTPRHYDQLILIRSPFLTNSREISGVDEAQFLWIVSRENPINQRTWRRVLNWFIIFGTPRSRFLRRLKKLPNPWRFKRGIQRYLDRAFLDTPSSGPGRIVAVAPAASRVHRIASAYGWPDEELDFLGQPIPGKGILDKPIARLYQYWRWIAAENDRSAPLFNRKRDAATKRIVNKWKSAAAAAGYGLVWVPDPKNPLNGHWRDRTEDYLILIGKLPAAPGLNGRN